MSYQRNTHKRLNAKLYENNNSAEYLSEALAGNPASAAKNWRFIRFHVTIALSFLMVVQV